MQKRTSGSEMEMPVASAGATKTAVTAAHSTDAQGTAAQIEDLQKQFTRQTEERKDELHKLMTDVQLLTKEVVQMKSAPASAHEPAAKKSTVSGGPRAASSLAWGQGRGPPVEEQPEAIKKEQWDAMKVHCCF